MPGPPCEKRLWRGVGTSAKRLHAGFTLAMMAAPLLSAYGRQTEAVKRMARDAHPSFEVATIKQSEPDDQNRRFTVQGRGILIENQTVQTMLEMSYGVHARQIENAPPWLGTERFDVRGLPDVEGQPNVMQFQEMVRKLLAERFGLKLHTGKRDMPRYTLTRVKGGPKMELTKSAPDALQEINGSTTTGVTTYQMNNVTVDALAHNLQANLDRPVVDETGLKGKYDLTLKWAREDIPAEADTDPNVPRLFTAIQEQLGLKMEPSKGQVEVLVIDHIERPTQN